MRNWSFSKKVVLVGCIFAATLLAVSVAGLTGFVRLEKSISQFADGFETNQLISKLESYPKEIRMLEAQAIIEPSADQYNTYIKQMNEIFSNWDKAISHSAEKVQGEIQKKNIAELQRKVEKRKELSERLIKAAFESDNDLAFGRLRDDEAGKNLEDKIDALSGELGNVERQAATLLKREAIHLGKSWLYWLALTTLVGTAVGLMLSQSILSGLTRNLNRIAEQFADTLQRMSISSHEIAAAGLVLTQNSTTQVTSLEDACAAIERLVTTVNVHAENAKQASNLAASGTEHAQNTKEILDKLTLTLKDLNQQNNETKLKYKEIPLELQAIFNIIRAWADKIKVIQDFSFQTKILSLNASAEAARAGTQGRGFANIADEIGHLHQNSTKAARELCQELDECIRQAEAIVQSVQMKLETLAAQGLDKLESGNLLASQCSQALTEVAGKASHLSSVTLGMSHAYENQSDGVAEISKTISKLAWDTRQGIAGAQECASTAHELSSQLDGLHSVGKQLVTLVKGSGLQPKRTRQSADENDDANTHVDVDLHTPTTSVEPAVPILMEPAAEAPSESPSPQRGKTVFKGRFKKAAGAEDMSFSNDDVDLS
jgi:methyl-accepting chemotaxis protein